MLFKYKKTIPGSYFSVSTCISLPKDMLSETHCSCHTAEFQLCKEKGPHAFQRGSVPLIMGHMRWRNADKRSRLAAGLSFRVWL